MCGIKGRLAGIAQNGVEWWCSECGHTETTSRDWGEKMVQRQQRCDICLKRRHEVKKANKKVKKANERKTKARQEALLPEPPRVYIHLRDRNGTLYDPTTKEYVSWKTFSEGRRRRMLAALRPIERLELL